MFATLIFDIRIFLHPQRSYWTSGTQHFLSTNDSCNQSANNQWVDSRVVHYIFFPAEKCKDRGRNMHNHKLINDNENAGQPVKYATATSTKAKTWWTLINGARLRMQAGKWLALSRSVHGKFVTKVNDWSLVPTAMGIAHVLYSLTEKDKKSFLCHYDHIFYILYTTQDLASIWVDNIYMTLSNGYIIAPN